MLKNELDIHVDDEIFWTDSKVVLGYINMMFVGSMYLLQIESSR